MVAMVDSQPAFWSSSNEENGDVTMLSYVPSPYIFSGITRPLCAKSHGQSVPERCVPERYVLERCVLERCVPKRCVPNLMVIPMLTSFYIIRRGNRKIAACSAVYGRCRDTSFRGTLSVGNITQGTRMIHEKRKGTGDMSTHCHGVENWESNKRRRQEIVELK